MSLLGRIGTQVTPGCSGASLRTGLTLMICVPASSTRWSPTRAVWSAVPPDSSWRFLAGAPPSIRIVSVCPAMSSHDATRPVTLPASPTT